MHAEQTPEQRFRERVKEVRARRGLSQRDLAARVGMSQAAIARIERGARKVRLDEANAIAEALGLPSTALYDADPKEIVVTELYHLVEETGNLFEIKQTPEGAVILTERRKP